MPDPADLIDPHRVLDRATREAFGEFRGLPTHSSGLGRLRCRIHQPNWPEFHFEWHTDSKRVYKARLGYVSYVDGKKQVTPISTAGKVRAEIIGEHVLSEGAAYNCVQTFLRGVLEGQNPNDAKPHLER